MVKMNDSLTVCNLSVDFSGKHGWINVLDDINITFAAQKFTAIIGESGCGKSVLGQAILGILPRNTLQRGNIYYGGITAREIGIIPQDPSASLNPVRKIAQQMQDILDTSGIKDKEHFYKKQCLSLFALQDLDRVLHAYPHELSGGMLQRVLCAMAISTKPQWILADEPTKGLDEKTGQIVLQNLWQIKNKSAISMITITHDIKLAQQVCDIVAVMYAGQIMEISDKLFINPLHPYTQGFLRALPQNGLHSMPGKAPIPGESLSGCCFAARCPYRCRRCVENNPDLYDNGYGAKVRCFLYAGG